MIVGEKKNKEALHLKREFSDMRDLIEQVGELYPEKNAYSYRVKPSDAESVKVTFTQMRADIRGLATEFISRGYEGKKIALIAKLSYPWVCVYFAAQIAGAVLVPLDKEWRDVDLADTVKKGRFGSCLRPRYR